VGNINAGRWLAGGIVAGLLMWIIEGAASQLYFDETMAALDRAGLVFSMGAGLLGYRMIGLYPDALILKWCGVGLVEMILMTMAGAWLYRD
jgi:hypothetical protein